MAEPQVGQRVVTKFAIMGIGEGTEGFVQRVQNTPWGTRVFVELDMGSAKISKPFNLAEFNDTFNAYTLLNE